MSAAGLPVGQSGAGLTGSGRHAGISYEVKQLDHDYFVDE
jgi:hypothetical protein